MSILETFICSLETQKGVVITPNAFDNNPNRPAESPFTVLFDLTNNKFTNNFGGDFLINARATNILNPYYVFTINNLPIGTLDTNQSGNLEVRRGQLVGASSIKTVKSQELRSAPNMYEFLVGEEFCNIDPESSDYFDLKVYVFEQRQAGAYNIFPTSNNFSSAVAVGSIRIRIASDVSRVINGELTEQELTITTDQEITTEELAEIDLSNAKGTFVVKIGDEIVQPTGYQGQPAFEIDALVGVTAEIDPVTGEFQINSVDSLNEDNQAGVVFEANHTVDLEGAEARLQVRRSYVITVNSSYQNPSPPAEDLGIPYDEIVENISISSYNLCSFKYNLHIEKYESFIAPDSIEHNLLPCFYNNSFYLNNRESQNSILLDEVEKIITLNGALPVEENVSLLTPSTTTITQEQEYSLESFYKNYGVVLNGGVQDEVLQNYSEKMSYKFMHGEEYEKFHEGDDYKKLFPFYNELVIPKARTGEYGALLEKYKKYDDFKILNGLFSDIPNTTVLIDGEEGQKRIQIANMLGAQDDLYGNQELPDDYMIYADPEDLNISPASQQAYSEDSPDYQLLDRIIKNEVVSLENTAISFNNNLRQDLYGSERDSVGGKETEVLFYKIKKYIESPTGVPVATICVPNMKNLPSIKYIDTQLKANKDYHYVVEAIILCKSREGVYHLLQEEVTSIHNVTLNKPPMPIDFNILPFLGQENESNKIRIKMNQSVGSGYYDIVSLDEEEERRAERIRISQGKTGEVENITSKKGYEFLYSPQLFDDTIHFENDDPIKVYEIYKLEDPPQRIEDFSSANVFRTVESYYEDVLQYNKEYYYMVRGIDSHGNISNPSPILRVMIVEEGKKYAVIRPYSFDEYPERKYNTVKKMRKFLRVKPLPADMTVKQEGSDYRIGGDTAEPWNKDYKIRVTSNTTGKMLDVNFKFTRERSLGNETN